MGEPALVSITNQPLLGRLKRKMMPQTLARKRQFLLSKTKRRQRERTALPMRLTNCIFKRPVTRITAHPGNEVRHRQQEETWEKPQQVCAYRRLQGLQAYSSEGGRLSTWDITNTMEIIAPRSAGESLCRADPGSLHTSPKPTTAQFLNLAEMIPGAGRCVPQILRGQPVTRGDVQRQTLKVKKIRERLAVALRADWPGRQREPEARKNVVTTE